MNKKIAVIPGDGIGPEIIQEAVKVLENRPKFTIDGAVRLVNNNRAIPFFESADAVFQ